MSAANPQYAVVGHGSRREIAERVAPFLRSEAMTAGLHVPEIADLSSATELVKNSLSAAALGLITASVLLADVVANERWRPRASFSDWLQSDLDRSSTWGYDMIVAGKVMLTVRTSGIDLPSVSHAIELGRAPEEDWVELAPAVTGRSVRGARTFLRDVTGRGPVIPEEDEVIGGLRRVINTISDIGVDDGRTALEKMDVGERRILSDDLVTVGNILLAIADAEA
jgi:hypothetical protein